MPPPRNGDGHIVLPLSVLTLFLSPQVLLQYLMQGFETFNKVQIYSGHVQKEKQNFNLDHNCRIMFPSIAYIFWTISHCSTVCVSASPSKELKAGI